MNGDRNTHTHTNMTPDQFHEILFAIYIVGANLTKNVLGSLCLLALAIVHLLNFTLNLA